MKYAAGQVYGSVTLVEKVGPRTWRCVCKCGLQVDKCISNLPRTIICSHACTLNPVRKHSMHGTKEYRAWKNIKTRCTNPKYRQAKDYGGRGIDFHPAWAADFSLFLQDVGLAPDKTYQIDRLDNNKGYVPGNVAWVSCATNCNNKRNNVLLTYEGETKTATEWGKHFGLKPSVVMDRVRRGWSVEKALTTPVKSIIVE